MPRIVRGGLIQASVTHDGGTAPEIIKAAMIEKHLALIEQAARQGVQILCLQELFYGPYFPAEQKMHWYGMTEPIPDGPTIRLMRETARRLGMVLIVPIYEVEQSGVYYNTAAVIDADGSFWEIPQESPPPLPSRLLGEILFPARQSGLSRVRDRSR